MTTVLPEINFLTTDPNELVRDVVTIYEEAEGRKLAQADPLYLIFLTFASVITKQNIAINDAARQNLLYYARDGMLDHKGAEVNTPRLQATAATVKVRYFLTKTSNTSRIVPKDSLVTTDESEVFFASVAEVVIPPNTLEFDIDFKCTVAGTLGNGFYLGQINTLVKPLPFVSHIENITVSNGGAGVEEDEPYRERVYLAPESFSNAGSSGAYEYFAKKASALIEDVYVYTPSPGYVNISILMKNGELPTQEVIDAVHDACNAKEVRPLTDFVTVEAPEVVHYNLDLTYYIETDAVNKELIHFKVQQAIEAFILWQSSKIGRDINDSKLIRECIRAGANRVNLNSPVFTPINPGQVPKLANKNIVFGGLEDD